MPDVSLWFTQSRSVAWEKHPVVTLEETMAILGILQSTAGAAAVRCSPTTVHTLRVNASSLLFAAPGHRDPQVGYGLVGEEEP
jgi:hypothetical protein